MKKTILKITRDGESEFSARQLFSDSINSDVLSSWVSNWETIRVDIINGGKAIKSGYLHIIASHDKWVCSDCIFNLNDDSFLFSVLDEAANVNFPTNYLLHYEFDWRKLQEPTKLDVVWCSSTYLIDYTTGYQAYRVIVRNNIINAIKEYERKRQSRTSQGYNK